MRPILTTIVTTGVQYLMFQIFKSTTFRRAIATYAMNLAGKVFSMVRRDATAALARHMQKMTLEQFKRDRLEVEGQDIIASNIEKSFIYLNEHVIDLTSDGRFSISIAGVELFATDLENVERQLFAFLKSKVFDR